MKRLMMNSSSNIVGRIEVLKKNQRQQCLPKETEMTYQSFVEEIIQDVQFTHTPYVEKKRKMISDVNSTL